MSHTPGPWHAHEEATIVRWGYVSTSEERNRKFFIASCFDVPDLSPDANTSEANARLIAAAPELLEALREVVAISDRKHNAWDKAHAAIAKATGGAK